MSRIRVSRANRSTPPAAICYLRPSPIRPGRKLTLDPVDNITQIMQVLRRQMAENLSRLRQSGALPPARADHAPAPAAQSLRETLQRRVCALSPEELARRGRMADVFAEAVLLEQFGGGLVNDPGVRDLIAQVAETMSADPTLEDGLSSLAGELRAG